MSLYQYFKSKKLKSEFIVFTSKNNEKEKINSILSKITKSKFNICSINDLKQKFLLNSQSAFFIDTTNYQKKILKNIYTTKSFSFFLDFFDYDEKMSPNLIFNLIDHNKSYEKKKHKSYLINKRILFEGPKNAIIRKEILELNKNKQRKINKNIEKIVISFGGSDPKNNLKKILEKLIQFKFLKNVKILTPKLNQNKILNLNDNNIISLYSNFNKFTKFINEADLLFCGGGTTLLESMHIGLPTIVLPQSIQEKKHANYYYKNKCCYMNEKLNFNKIFNKDIRFEISKNSKKIIDGYGMKRIYELFNKFIKNRRVLFIGAGLAQLGSILFCKDAGYEIYSIDENSGAIGIKYSDYYFCMDINNYKNIVDICLKFNIKKILCVSNDSSLLAYAKACEILKIQALSYNNALISKNKILQIKLLNDRRVNIPKFSVLNKLDDYKKIQKKISYPSVIKPADSSGSRGVYYLKNHNDFKKFYIKSFKYSKIKKCLVQEFIDGKEYAVDGFVINKRITILCVSEKERSQLPYLLDTQVLFPTKSTFKINNEIHKTALKVLKNLKFNNCPFHIEIIVNKNKAFFVEASARGPGFKVFTDILPKVTKINTTNVLLEIMDNPKSNIKIYPKKNYIILLLFLEPKNLKNLQVNIQNKINSLKYVDELVMYNKKINNLSLTKGEDRIGHIIIKSKDYISIENTKKIILEMIE